ncbi:MAG: tetratricopeptide repeat protein, partial [Chitinophagales bacterium]
MFTTRLLIVLLLTVPAGSIGYAQQPDSLFKVYNDFGGKNSDVTAQKISWLNETGDSYLALANYSKAFEYYSKALALTIKTGHKKKIATQHVRIANMHEQAAALNKALESYGRAIVIFDQLKDYSSIGVTYFTISRAYRNLSDFAHQLEYLQKSMKWYEKAGNHFELAKTYREVGYYYMNIGNNQRAVDFFLNALELFEKLGSQMQTAQVLGDLGHAYLLMKFTDQAFDYLQRALRLNQQIGNKSGMATNYWILGDYYFRIQMDLVSASDCFQKSLALFTEVGPKDRVAYVLLNIAEMYVVSPDSALVKANMPVGEKKYLRAIDNQKKAIQIFKEFSPESERVGPLYNIMSAYLKINRYDSAYEYQTQYIDLRDKIFGVENQKDIVRLETRHERERYEDSLK